MTDPLDGPIQPGDDSPPFTDEERDEILRTALEQRDMLVRERERLLAEGVPADDLIKEFDESFAEVKKDEARLESAEEAVLQSNANLMDHSNRVAFDTVRFAIALEAQWPELRAKTSPEGIIEVEAYLRDWRENRADWLEILTAEQRREIGY